MNKDRMLNVRLDDVLYKRLKINLVEKGITLSDFMRGIVVWYLGREDEKRVSIESGRSEEPRSAPESETKAK